MKRHLPALLIAVLVGCSQQPSAKKPDWSTLLKSRVQRSEALLNGTQWNEAQQNVEAMKAYLLTLGQNGDPAGLPEITAALEDSELQGTAIFAYGEVEGADATPLLALTDTVAPEHRARLAEALSKRGTEVPDKITAYWQTLDEPLKNQTLMYFFRNANPTLTEAVLKRLREDAQPQNTGYLYYLFRSETKVPATDLLRWLEVYEGDSQALIYASRIVPETNTPELTQAWIGLLAHADWRIRTQALQAMPRDTDTEAAMSKMLDDENPNVVRTALSRLSASQDPEIHRLLGSRLSDLSPCQVVTLVTQTESDTHRKPFLAALASWKDSEEPWKRRQWVRHVGPQQPEALKPLVQKSGGGLAALAQSSLLQSPDIDTTPWLEQGLASKDPYLMAGVVSALAEMKENRPMEIDALLPLAEQAYPEPDFHYALLHELPRLVKQKARRTMILNQFQAHPDYLVRLEALRLTEDPTAAQRQAVFQSGWQHTVPQAVLDTAAELLREPSAREWVLTTSKGEVRIRLFGKDAPITCANMVYLSERDYFANMPFHRVVPNFVVQGGDSRGDGSGGPGHTIPCEVNRHPYVRGTVGMALAGKDTGGSQFFICHSDQPHLNGGYTVFGKVTQGMDVVDRLEEGDLILKASTRQEP
ncbi:Peptidylprolyl isomerase [Sulfidibacter corallicola]|uniref:peptidylprolyl isomerase n=1 Tax=Sulfidibacter corallicola TaxID=2818388 RepID=A0A8A4TUN5_SULCO|nr:peptidylprolyl isomerase [Sulfidibacter corallicola]QTD53193.1 peptidylprolyl isomerase [Sulfidibacter corallicola]